MRISELTVTPSNTSAPDPNKFFASAVEMIRSSLSVGIRFAASMGPFAILSAVEIMNFLSGSDEGSSVTIYSVSPSAYSLSNIVHPGACATRTVSGTFSDAFQDKTVSNLAGSIVLFALVGLRWVSEGDWRKG